MTAPATISQTNKLQILAKERGLTDRDSRLAAACSTLANHGYPSMAEDGLSSFRTLTSAQAHALIDAWQRESDAVSDRADEQVKEMTAPMFPEPPEDDWDHGQNNGGMNVGW